MKILSNLRQLGPKGFVSKWKEGITKVTPLQQVIAQIPSYLLILFGVIIGLIVAIKTKNWWLAVVLVGALGINIMSFLSTYQRYLLLKGIDDELQKLRIQAVPELSVETQTNNQKEVQQ